MGDLMGFLPVSRVVFEPRWVFFDGEATRSGGDGYGFGVGEVRVPTVD